MYKITLTRQDETRQDQIRSDLSWLIIAGEMQIHPSIHRSCVNVRSESEWNREERLQNFSPLNLVCTKTGASHWSPHSRGGNGCQLMAPLKSMCYCLLFDWINVNIWEQHCCLLGGQAQAASTISEFASSSRPYEWEAKAGTLEKPSRETATHHCYTISPQP